MEQEITLETLAGQIESLRAELREPQPKAVDKKTAANLLACSTRTIDRLIERGDLEAVYFPTGGIRIRVEEIDRFLDACSKPASGNGKMRTAKQLLA